MRSSTSSLALAGLCLSMLMPSLDTSIAHAALPSLANAFAASFPAVQWIVLAYLLAITSLIVGAGRIGDLFGRRRMLLCGIGVFTAASLLCGLAPNLGMLIAARALQGLGAALMLALTLASVADTVGKDRSGSTMGLLGTMSAIGTTLGPPLGGLLIGSLGWQWIFLINLPLGLLNLVLVARYLPHDAPAAKLRGFDVAGMLALAMSLGAYALAMTMGQARMGVLNAALLALAVLGLLAFLRIETKAAAPLIQLSMFRNPVLSAGLAMSALVSTVMMSTLVVGPFYLARTLGFGAIELGLALCAGPLVAALAGLPAGRLVDRVGAPAASIAGLVGLVLGCGALALLPVASGVAGYLGPIVCMTASYALFQAANNSGIMSGTEAGQRGLVAGMLSLSRNIGLVTGVAFMGAVFAFGAGARHVQDAAAQAVATGMHSVFAVAALLIGAALGIACYAYRNATSLRKRQA